MRLELFPFRYRDPLTGKWVRARYVAERHVIAEGYAEFEIIGPPEIRRRGPRCALLQPGGRRAPDGSRRGALERVVHGHDFDL
jgi:hypothetical protein